MKRVETQVIDVLVILTSRRDARGKEDYKNNADMNFFIGAFKEVVHTM